MRFGVLGTLLIYDQTGTALPVPVAQHRRLLAILLLRANRTVSFDEIADTLWDGEPPAGFRSTVRNYVRLLRRTLGSELAGRLVTRAPGYLIEVGDDELDMRQFTRLCRQGRQAMRAQGWAEAHDHLTAALALWRGTAFADVASRRIQDSEVPHLGTLRLQAWEWRIEADLNLNRASEVVDELQQLVDQHPLREQFWTQLMLALYRTGRQSDALAAYAQVRRMLQAEVGVEPGPALSGMHLRILAADTSLHAVGPARQQAAVTKKPAQLPLDIRGFSGRGPELAALNAIMTEAATEPAAAVITAVSGTAGVGKSALAVRWAHTVTARFPDGQLYVNLRGFSPNGAAMAPAEAVRGFLDALGIPPARIPAGLDAQAALYRSELAGKRVLVLLDNARDAEQARPLLPGTPTALVIVTSRHQLTGLLVTDGAHPLALDVLSPAEAQELLTRRLGARVAAEPAAVRRIIAACARLPLALSVAAARARQTGFLLATLAADLDQAGSPLDALETGDPASQIRAVFSSSISALSPAAARLFRLLGLHPGPDLSVAAAAALSGQPGPQTRQALGELARSSLMAEHAPGRYSFHDLLRAYAIELAHDIDGERVRQEATMRLLAQYAHTAHAADRLLFPNRDPMPLPLGPPTEDFERLADYAQAMAWLDAERRVLLAAVGHAASAGFDVYAWQLAWVLDTFLHRRGHPYDHAAAWRTALHAARRLGDKAAEAHSHRRLGNAEVEFGRYDKALHHLQGALDLYRQTGDRAGEAFAHYNLGFLRKEQGRPEDALDHVQRAFALHHAAGHRRGQATALNAAGNCHALLGDHNRAVDACEQALVLFREMGDRHGQATTLDSLGNAQHQLGWHDHAIVSYRSAVVLIGDLGHGRHEAKILTHLGDTQQAAGQPGEARAAWTRALGLLDELDEPDTASLHARLDGRHAIQGEQAEAAGVPSGLGRAPAPGTRHSAGFRQ